MTRIMQTLRAFTRRRQTKEAIRQSDAIMALDGFRKNTSSCIIDAAVLAGRVTFGQAANELGAWAEEHKTTDGFIESRAWLTEQEKRTYRNRPPGDDDQPIDPYPYQQWPIPIPALDEPAPEH